MTVSAVLGRLAAGRSIEPVVDGYPQLGRDDVLEALGYASAYTREREILLASAG